LLYFACHGTPDFDRPTNVYLLTHDADPNDISGTAVRMREIDLSLGENLLAKHVVIIVDTCHSAAFGGTIARRSVTSNDAQIINAYLQKVSETNGGVALLTSAEASESSQEGKFLTSTQEKAVVARGEEEVVPLFGTDNDISIEVG
jgi:uncharacterized caspase-like protein